MGFQKHFYDAVEELALNREDWFLSRNLVRPLEEKLGKKVSPVKVGWYLTRMVDRLILESRFIREAPLDRIKEYRVRGTYVRRQA